MTGFFWLAALEGLTAAAALALIPADAKNQALLGFSWLRLGLLALTLAAAACLAWLGWRCWKTPGLAQTWLAWLSARERQAWLPALLAALLLAGWIAVSLPAYRWGLLGASYERLRPLLTWLTLVAAECLAGYYLFCRGIQAEQLRRELQGQRTLLRAGGTALALFALTWGLILFSGVGLIPDDRFWNEAGVPILGLQLLLVWVVSCLGGLLLGGPGAAWSKPALRRLDGAVCLGLWLLAALLWTQLPMERSHFAVGPYPPNNVLYPSSDAQVYDLGGQYMLIGQGINNRAPAEKVLYMFFLGLLRLIAGQDYLRAVQVQAALLAGFPALLYLLGVRLHSRSAGLLAGLATILREGNSISATLQIQVSNSRLMMTEFPTAVGVTLMLLILLAWFKQPGRRWAVLLAGGLLGALMMIRTNSLLLAPIVLALMALHFGRAWKAWLRGGLLFCLGAFLVMAPWMLVNRSASGENFLVDKIRQVISTRYVGSTGAPQPSPTSSSSIVQGTATQAVTAEPVATQAPGGQPTPAPAKEPPKLQTASVLRFAPAHFLHNQVMAVLILPLSGVYDDLVTTLKAPYWKLNWVGPLSPGQGVFLALNLLVLALGIGSAWNAGRWLGLAPLLLELGYFASNGLGRVSGARYLVPADWTIIFYLALGLVQLTRWGMLALGVGFEKPAGFVVTESTARPSRFAGLWAPLGTAAGLLGLGALLLFSGNFFPQRYPSLTVSETLAQLLQRGSLQQAGVPEQAVSQLQAAPAAAVLHGLALYPKYYGPHQKDACVFHPSSEAESGYPRLVFQLIGPQSGCVILPLKDAPASFPDAVTVDVLGCWNGIDIHAQAVVIEGLNDSVLLRSPAAPWTCPLPRPICDGNGNCK